MGTFTVVQTPESIKIYRSSVHMNDSKVPTNATSCFIGCYKGVSIWAEYVKKGNRAIYPVSLTENSI